MKIELFGSTDVGMVRDHNEDDFVLCRDLATQDWSFKRDEQYEIGELGLVLFVADGMGGTNAGEVASATAVESMQETFQNVTELPGSGSDKDILNFLKQAIVKAHDKIVYKAIENPTFAGMGTTAVVAWVFKDACYVAWSGDSRMYIYRDDVDLYPATDDHSMVWELVQKGQLTAEESRTHEASNIITQSLGDDARAPKPDAKKFDLCKGDRVLLCSDGLNGMLSDNMMYGILSARMSPADTCKELIAAANQAGGTDNITVQLLDVLEGNIPPVAKKQPKTGEVKTSAGAGGVAASVSSTDDGSGKKIAIAVVATLLFAGLVYFLFLKPNGEHGEDVNTVDSTNVMVDTALIPPLETPEPEPDEINGDTESSTSSSSSTPAPVNNTPPPAVEDEPVPVEEDEAPSDTPPVDEPEESPTETPTETPPTNVLTPVNPDGGNTNKPTIPSGTPDSLSKIKRDSILNSRTP